MGFQPSNALNAIPDVHTKAELKSLWLAFGSVQKSVSTLIRNNEAVVDYTPSSITLTAGSGLTGGGDLTADRTFAVGAGTGITVAADSVAIDSAYLGANPTGTIGLTAVNGSATSYLRSDGAPALSVGIIPTWTGVHTFSAQDVHNAGVSLGTSGRINSAVTTAAAAIGIYLKPTNTFTPTGGDRWVWRIDDATGNTHLCGYENGPVELGGNSSGTVDGMLVIGATTSKNAGIFFAPQYFSGAGQSFLGVSGTVGAAYFKATSQSSATMTKLVGGLFETYNATSQTANIDDLWGAWLKPIGTVGGSNSGRTWARVGGWRVVGLASIPKNGGAFTNLYGGYVESLVAGTVNGTGASLTNAYGIYVEEQTKAATINNGIFLANATAGYKAIAIRDQNAWIGSAAAAELTIGGTNFRCASTNQGVFGVAAIARPTNAIAAAAFVANTSGIANDTATWGGYTAGQVVQALQNYGILT